MRKHTNGKIPNPDIFVFVSTKQRPESEIDCEVSCGLTQGEQELTAGEKRGETSDYLTRVLTANYPPLELNYFPASSAREEGREGGREGGSCLKPGDLLSKCCIKILL